MITARFRPNQDFSLGELLGAARVVLTRAQREAQSLKLQNRKALAAAILKLRSRAYRRAKCCANRELTTERAKLLIDGEGIYRHSFHQAQKDCLNLALSVVEKVIGEIDAAESSLLVNRIERMLASSEQNSPLAIELSGAKVEVAKKELQKKEISVAVKRNDSISDDAAVLITASGRVEISWREDFAVIAEHLKAALDRKLMESNSDESSR